MAGQNKKSKIRPFNYHTYLEFPHNKFVIQRISFPKDMALRIMTFAA